MRIGSSLALVFLVLLVSFVALGFLFAERDHMQQERQQLQQQYAQAIQACQKQVAELRRTVQVERQGKAQALAEVQRLQRQLAARDKGVLGEQTTAVTATVTSPKASKRVPAVAGQGVQTMKQQIGASGDTIITVMVIVGIVITVIMAGYGAYTLIWPKRTPGLRGSAAVTGTNRGADDVMVRMTRQQLRRSISWLRQSQAGTMS